MKSMTGFGRSSFDVGDVGFRIEIRSVNSRFLDIKIRHPWSDPEIDHEITKQIKKRLNRGRVDIVISAELGSAVDSNYELNESAAKRAGEIIEKLARHVGSTELATQLLSPMRELLVVRSSDFRQIKEALYPSVDKAIENLISMRKKEGLALKKELLLYADELGSSVQFIEKKAKGEPEKQRERLKQRLRALDLEERVDVTRFAQEVALLAERCNVDEELGRLNIHLEEFRKIAKKKDSIGRKLEFMQQELNRELNTIASKTFDAEIGTMVVDAKSTLEKMREQIQNVE